MLKIVKNLLLIIAVTTSLSAADLSKKEIAEIENLNLLKSNNAKVLLGTKKDSFYLLNVKIGDKVDQIFLSSDKKHLVFGTVVDSTTGQKLTVPSIPVDLSNTKNKEALTFGTGKDEYVLFTDPECPYCKKFEAFFPQIEDKVSIKVFYFPLSFHKNARAMSLYVMSQKNNKEKVKKMLNIGKTNDELKQMKFSKDLEAKLDEQMKIAQELGINGTPTIFDKNGNKVNWPLMLQGYGVKLQ